MEIKRRESDLEGNATEIFFLLPRSIDPITATLPRLSRCPLHLSLSSVSPPLSRAREWARRDATSVSTYLRTASRPELAIQVFKGHYKSDKPDGVISNGEAEVRHYAMETSISGGIVATICFSLFTRSPSTDGGYFFFSSRKTDGKRRAPDAPTFNARRSRPGAFRSNSRIDDTIRYIHTRAPFTAARRRNAPSRARAIDVPRKTDDAVEAPSDE